MECNKFMWPTSLKLQVSSSRQIWLLSHASSIVVLHESKRKRSHEIRQNQIHLARAHTRRPHPPTRSRTRSATSNEADKMKQIQCFWWWFHICTTFILPRKITYLLLVGFHNNFQSILSTMDEQLAHCYCWTLFRIFFSFFYFFLELFIQYSIDRGFAQATATAITLTRRKKISNLCDKFIC